MTTRTVRPASLLALALLLSAAAATAAVPNHAGDSPTHGPGRRALEAFVVDDLPRLVVGQEFDWRGHHYKITRVRQVTRCATQATRTSDVNNDVATQGWLQAIINLEIDGQLTRARVEGNAKYVVGSDGWAWDRVLLFLGLNDWYDFVSREIR